MRRVRYVNCPHCGSQVAWVIENRYRPFCSERCKLVDLGDWAMERHRVTGQEQDDIPDAEKQD